MHYPEIISLDDHERPAGPAVNRLEQWYQSMRKKIIDRDSEVAVTEDELSKASTESLRAFTAEPDCGFVSEALDKAYLSWINSTSTDDHLRMLVFPPCDHSNLVAAWARNNELDVLEAPARSELLSGGPVQVDIQAGSGPLVIPRLEDWFIRHRSGLRHIRALLTALQSTSRHCLVSCSSWSWVYLRRAVNADLVLPAPESLAPMDAEKLGHWLLDCLSDDANETVTFRDHNDGKEILAREEGGSTSDNYLQQLADDSGGIPWIAWQLWRRSLRTKAEYDDESNSDEEDSEKLPEQEEHNDEGTVFWVVRNQPLSLPRGHERAACLLLQALLIHDSLPEQILEAVLPSIGESSLVVALIRSGFVERHDGGIRCLAVAYPVIWSSLEDSGMTMAHL